jgi:SnoaL-like domain
MAATLSDQIRARLEIVEEHVRRENTHDLPGIMTTFGNQAWYDDEPWGEHHVGRDAVHRYYENLLAALPDLHIDIAHRLAAEDGVALEVRISGTTSGPGVVSRPRVDEWSSRYADSSHSTKRGSSRVNASTTIGVPCYTRWGSTIILRLCWDNLRLSSHIRSRCSSLCTKDHQALSLLV